MTTSFLDTKNTRATVETWCEQGLTRAQGNSSDVASFYAASYPEVWVSDWLNGLDMTDSVKCKEMVLQYIGEIATSLPAGEGKTRLAALAASTATAQDEVSWVVASRKSAPIRAGGLIDALARWELGADDLLAYMVGLQLVTYLRRANDSKRDTIENDILTLFRSRCTLDEFTVNGEWV